MSKIYYIGDWAILSGPTFYETPFQVSNKGLEIFNYGTWLKGALESSGEHQVTSVPSWDFYKLGPGEYENIIDEYDVIVLVMLNQKYSRWHLDFLIEKYLASRFLLILIEPGLP